MHVSPAKHSYLWLPRKFDYTGQTRTLTDTGQSDPYVPLCFTGDTKIAWKLPWQKWNVLCVLTDAEQSDPYVPLCFAGDTKIISVSLLFKYLLNIAFLWKIKIKHISKLFNVTLTWLCLGYFFWRYTLLSVWCQAKLPCPSREQYVDLSRTPFN